MGDWHFDTDPIERKKPDQPMNNDVRAAELRLRKVAAAVNPEDIKAMYGVHPLAYDVTLVVQRIEDDRKLLADAWLAEHPADSAEPKASANTVRAAAESLHQWATDPNATGVYAATKELAEIVSAHVLAGCADSDKPGSGSIVGWKIVQDFRGDGTMLIESPGGARQRVTPLGMADDVEPITETWLRSGNWEYHIDSKDWSPEFSDIAFYINRASDAPNVWSAYVEENYWPIDLHTRGCVRRLAQVLGITLTN